MGDAALKTAAEYFGVGTLGEAVRDILTKTGPKRPVVLYLDEAHGRVNAGYPGVERSLLDLHTTGIGAPCVMLLTGLGITYDGVVSIKGLSRLARSAVHEVEALPIRDCERSTRMMLGAMNATRPAHIRDRLATLTGKLAHEWPAHLNGAQTALCEEIVRAGGNLRDVDAVTVRERSDAMRRDYYHRRLAVHQALRIDGSLTRRILVDVARAQPKSERALDLVCAKALDRDGATEYFERRGATSTVIANALVEKGIVRTDKRLIVPSIPSMVDWAADQIRVEPPRRAEPAELSR